MEKFSRAERRYQLERIKVKRKTYWGATRKEPLTPRQFGIVASTPQVCSCWMCRNARKGYGLTTQERIQVITFKENIMRE